jgi:hypothetical protein
LYSIIFAVEITLKYCKNQSLLKQNDVFLVLHHTNIAIHKRRKMGDTNRDVKNTAEQNKNA